MAVGMGCIRTSGDLVAWMQMTRRMKLADAKQYVADKLEIAVIDQGK
jgi:dimethylamine--corrinoid protein Co-methyltransferase